MRACAGMCRAHGIAHQKVTERGDLRKALQAAWTLNKHSVVEVITNRDSNVTHHRSIQERVRQAVLRALRTVSMPAGAAMCHTRCSFTWEAHRMPLRAFAGVHVLEGAQPH